MNTINKIFRFFFQKTLIFFFERFLLFFKRRALLLCFYDVMKKKVIRNFILKSKKKYMSLKFYTQNNDIIRVIFLNFWMNLLYQSSFVILQTYMYSKIGCIYRFWDDHHKIQMAEFSTFYILCKKMALLIKYNNFREIV